MIVKESGQRYELQTANGVPVVEIIFCKMEKGQFIDGITNEELIEVLIHRMKTLVQQKPSQENMNTLTHLNQSKEWMKVRNFKKIQNRSKNDSTGNGLHVQAESGQARQ